MSKRDRRGAQLSVELPPELLQRLRAEASQQDRPVAVLVRRWIEAGLSGELGAAATTTEGESRTGLMERVEALERAVAQLQQQPRPRRSPASAPAAAAAPAAATPPAAAAEPPVLAPITAEGAITTAQLADQLGMRRTSLNERLRRAGGAKVGMVVAGWRCVGQGAGPNGGPLRWLWELA